MVRNSNLFQNAFGAAAIGASAVLRVGRSTVTGNGTGFFTSGGTLDSYGDNYLGANATDGSATGTISLR